MKRKIQSYITELRDTVIAAGLNYEVWWIYKEKNSRKKYVDTMNDYTMFFQTSIHAHFVALLVALYRLYETRPDTINIPGLLKLLDENDGISKAALNEIRYLHQEAHNLWIKVSILRNEVFGHRSSKYSVADVFKRAGVTPNELTDLIEKTKVLLNKITHEWDKDTHAFNLEASHDTHSLLEDLTKLRELRSKKGLEATL